MNPEKQRIAIAEACGWQLTSPKWNHWTRGGSVLHGDNLPRYLTDLNAMHEAEKTLTPMQSERYAEFILDVLLIPSPFIGTARCAFLTGHATAAQRAEAFLRTIGKWEEEKP